MSVSSDAIADLGREALEASGLLRDLGPEARALIEGAFTTERYAFGEVIVAEGSEPAGLLVLVEGSIRVLTTTESGDEVTLAVLEPSAEVIGLSFLEEPVSPATMRARTPATVLRIDRGVLAAVAARHPELRAVVRHRRQLLAIKDFLLVESAFGRLPTTVVYAVAGRMELHPVTAGERVINEGDPGEVLYVVREGRLQVSAAASGGQTVGFLRAGDLIGERALLLGEPRSATVTAIADGLLLALSADAYRELSAEHPELAELLNLRVADGYAPAPAVPLDFADPQAPRGDSLVPEPAAVPAAPQRQPAVRGRRRLRGFPLVRQLDETDCGAACLAMMCRHFGRRRSMFRIRSAAATSVDGTSLLGLKRGAEALGLVTATVKLSPSRLSDLALPAIVHWEHNHWVVLYRVDEEHVRIADPGQGLQRVARAEAERLLTGYALSLTPSESFLAEPDDKQSARWLLQFVRPQRRALLAAAVLALLAAAAALVIPVIAQHVIDDALPRHDQTGVNTGALALLGVLVVGAVAMVCQRVMLAGAAVRVDGSLLDFLTGRLLALPMSYFNARRIGDIERRLNSVTLIRQFVIGHGVVALTAAAQLLVALVLMAAYSPLLTLVFCAVAPLYAALLWASRRWMRPAYDGAEHAFGRYQSLQTDAVKGIESVKALGGERELQGLILRNFSDMRTRVYRSDLYSMLFEAAIVTLGSLSLALFVWIGSLQVLHEHLTLGGLVAFNSLVLLASAPLATLMLVWDDAQYAAVLVARMNDIIEPPPEQGTDRSALAPVPTLSGDVTLTGLVYAFPGCEDRPLLADISLEVPAGTKVAIVGRSGSGKTTLVKLLVGLLEPTAGTIRYDTVDLQTLDWRQLRKHIGFVLQDNYLFDDTIARNIAFGEVEPDLPKVIAAARTAAAAEFIEQLPFGYDTKVGDSGISLSGGQRQRIAIARAIYHQPPIIILDEATSALDTESELAVKQQMGRLLEGRTSFTIAHRLSTIREADVILVLDNGSIVERGTHAELIERRGLYYYLARRQLEL